MSPLPLRSSSVSTLLAAGALLLPALALAGPVVAALPFANHSQDGGWDPLGKGLADMMTTDLANNSGIQVVERQRLSDVLGELSLQQSVFIDPATAQTVGKGLGATHLVTGPLIALDAAIAWIPEHERANFIERESMRAHHEKAKILNALGRQAEAMAELQRGLDRFPTSEEFDLDEGWSTDDVNVVLQPGESYEAVLAFEGSTDNRADSLFVESTDLDEPRIEIELRVGSAAVGVGDPAPTFAYTGLNTGEVHDLGSQQGKVVLISYFAVF